MPQCKAELDLLLRREWRPYLERRLTYPGIRGGMNWFSPLKNIRRGPGVLTTAVDLLSTRSHEGRVAALDAQRLGALEEHDPGDIAPLAGQLSGEWQAVRGYCGRSCSVCVRAARQEPTSKEMSSCIIGQAHR